jgi:hydroxymethylpyrimidine pyrophosphatase-like HAD family hydrolase
MYCRAIACDFDGTGAENGHLAPEVSAALGTAKAQGIITLLVTGRVLEEIQAACPDLSVFDAVVAENGALIWFPSSNHRIHLGLPPPDSFLGELRAQNVPFHTGAVVVGTWSRYAGQVLELIHRSGLDSQLVFNREALMILPSGINKASGVRQALEELRRSEKNLVAVGDAENDVPLLAVAEVGLAPRNSVPAVAAMADDRLAHPGGAGVARYVYDVLERGGILPTPHRHRLTLGHKADGPPALFPASGTNALICGDPRSGKSWLAGLLAEQLIEKGYRLCIIDPEGDYVQLGRRSKILSLGYDLSLPAPSVVPRILSDEPLSVVLNLSALSPGDQNVYVDRLLAALEEPRAVTGIPHWVVIDEAHYFFHRWNTVGKRIQRRTGNFILITYRPSLIAAEVYSHLSAYLFTKTTVDEERYFITALLQTRGPADLSSRDALKELEMPRAGMLIGEESGSRWEVFTPGPRVTNHAHHARKYADTRLADDKAFRFLNTDSPAPVVAHNVMEFHDAVQMVSLESLRHHLSAGDFSRWAADVLGDEQLARGLRKLERIMPIKATPDRKEILAHIEDHYLIEKREEWPAG